MKHSITTVLFCSLVWTMSMAQTPLSINGRLSVCGNKLCNEYGNPVQLRGMSTHGTQWYGWGDCLTEASLDALAYDWGSDILRIATYVQEGGWESDPRGFEAQVNLLIQEAEDRGMYALIDWHQLSPGDPNANTANAKVFFQNICSANANRKNVIYDIANEPNNVSWNAIKDYADEMIPFLRQYDDDAVILCGTHGWASLGVSDNWIGSSQDIVNNPITHPNFMYTFHFYATDHQQAYYNEFDSFSDNYPVFVTEWGSQEATGDGVNDFVMAQQYVDLMRQKQISWCNWNYSDDFRTGAVWNSGTCASGVWSDANLKPAGQWIKDKILNPADNFVGAGACTLPDLGEDVSLCGVGSVTLDGGISAANGRTFTWERNDVQVASGANANTFSASQAGTYRLTVDSASCSVSDEIIVSATLPALDLGSDVDLCSPAVATLSIDIAEQGRSYEWRRQGDLLGSSATLVVNEPGVYSATVSANGCPDVTDDVTVTSSLPVVDDAVACIGSSATLEIQSSGNSFEWYDENDQLVSTGTSFTTPNLNQTTNYYVIDAGGASGSVGETANGGSGWSNDQSQFEYKVRFDALQGFTLDYVTVFANSSQSFNIIIEEADGTPIGTVPVTVVNGSNRLAIDIDIPQGTNHVIYPDGGAQLWLDDNVSNYPYTDANNTVSITSISPYWDVNEVYTSWFVYFYNWEFSSGNSCDPKEVEVVVDVCTGNATDYQLNNIEVFPNPANDIVTVSGADLKGSEVTLRNQDGSLILKESGFGLQQEIDLQDLSSGVYILQINSTEGSSTHKLIKE